MLLAIAANVLRWLFFYRSSSSCWSAVFLAVRSRIISLYSVSEILISSSFSISLITLSLCFHGDASNECSEVVRSADFDLIFTSLTHTWSMVKLRNEVDSWWISVVIMSTTILKTNKKLWFYKTLDDTLHLNTTIPIDAMQ